MTRGGGPTGERVAWAGAERTSNMWSMLVKLDVLKLSGWLNADAPCRVQREGIDERAAGCQEAGGRLGGGLSDVQREPDWWVGGMGRRRAHPKHLVHGRDAGGVDVQRLVERVRALPSPKAGIA